MTKEYPNLKIIRVKNAAGKTVEYYRHRITGRAYGSNRERALRLWAADQLALDGPEGRNRVPGTVANAIKQFQESKVWETIAESTRTLWRPYFADLEHHLGELLPESVTPRIGIEFIKTIEVTRGRGAARNARKAANRFWGWAKARGLFKTEPPFSFEDGARSPKSQASAKKPIWTREHLDTFFSARRVVSVGGNPDKIKSERFRTETLPDDMRLAVLIGFFTTQRQADILDMNARKLSVDGDGRWWYGAMPNEPYRQKKTNAQVVIPIHLDLEAEFVRQGIKPGQDRHLVQTESGAQFDAANFRRKFRTWMNAAELDRLGLTFHALRSSGMVAYAQSGSSIPKIASLSGHSLGRTQSIIDVYIPRSAQLAHSAVTEFERSSDWTIPPPGDSPPPRARGASAAPPALPPPKPGRGPVRPRNRR